VNLPSHLHEDEGSAVVDFVLIAAVLVMLVLGIMQVCFAVHVRNTLASAAAEGARYAASADRSTNDALGRTRLSISQSVGSRFARDISVGRQVIGGLDFAEVTVRAAIPLVGTLGGPATTTVRGHALLEVQP
jgi:Flp pilus assembly protein TadG